MEIYEQSEIFIEKSGDSVFDHMKLILKENEKYFYATIKNRLCPLLVIDVNKLQPVPIRDFWPPFDRSSEATIKQIFHKATESLILHR